MQKGGYIIISITDSDIYNKLQIAMKINKPILFYENIDVCYFIDTISGGEVTSEIIDDEEVITYHDIIMKKGSKTFTITSANAVSSEGEIQLTPDNFYPLLENIKDASGNLRFVEGSGNLREEIEGVTITYTRWSLSGTHLMCVIAGSVLNETILDSSHRIIVDFDNIPNWIFNKLFPMGSQYNIYDIKTITLWKNDFTSAQEFRFTIAGDSANNRLTIGQQSNVTIATANKNFRVQFDLLIDNETEE